MYIPLIKEVIEQHIKFPLNTIHLNAGYDSPSTDQQINNIGCHSVIDYSKRREQKIIGFDKHFTPTCVYLKYSYCYGSQSWKDIYKKRTSVERAIGYRKEFFQLTKIHHCTGSKAKVHFDLCVLVNNVAKLACDRINKKTLYVAA